MSSIDDADMNSDQVDDSSALHPNAQPIASSTIHLQDNNENELQINEETRSPLLLHKRLSGQSIHSSSISISPPNIAKDNDKQLHENIIRDIARMDTAIKQRNNDPSVYHALKESVNLNLKRSNQWKSRWNLRFDDDQLENNFVIYFAHRYLLKNQASFLMFSLFYIVILFIFEVKSKYEWLSVAVHCILIVIIFIALILSMTTKFKIHIHKLTVFVIFIILNGLNIQSLLSKMEISSQALLSLILVIFGSSSYLSIRYCHLLICFVLFGVINLFNFRLQNISHFFWFNMLLCFGMCCSSHTVRWFEIGERKLFLRVIEQMKETKKSLSRQLTVYETVSIAQLIENDRTGADHDVLDKVLQQFIVLGALFQHLPDHESDADDDEELDECGHVHVHDHDEDDTDEKKADLDIFAASFKQYKQARICKLRELPDFYNGYPFIPFGYRLDFGYLEALQSLFSWHNETVNMWTEIAPLILNAFCLSFFVANDELWSMMGTEDKWCVLVGAILILIVRPICSLLAHTFYIISSRAHEFWWRVDYVSICVTMLCEGAVSGHFTFNCQHQLKVLFLTCVSCMFISTMLSTLVSQSIQIRAASFSLFVVFATGCPFLYQWISFAQSANKELLRYLSLWTIGYVLAALALIIKSSWFPERCCQQQRHCLSYVGASHQIWHILINACLSISVYCWIVYLRYKYDNDFSC